MHRSAVVFCAAAAACAAAQQVCAAEVLAKGYDWSGAYFGVNAGLAANDSTVDSAMVRGVNSYRDVADRIEANQDALIGGALIGYSVQIDRIVLGAEADANYLGFSDTRSKVRNFDAFTATNKTSFDASWFGTLRGRLGYSLGGFLLFGSAGLAVGDMEATASIKATDVLTGRYATWHGSADAMNWGWTAGAGLEYGISNVSFGLEYLYVDLGGAEWNVRSSGSLADVVAPSGAKGSAEYQFSVARATAKLRF